MILQVISILVWFFIVPMLIGFLVIYPLHREDAGFCLVYSSGYMAMFSLFMIISLPMILMRQAFHRLFYLMAGVYLLLVVLSVFLNWRIIVRMIYDFMANVRRFSWTVYAAAGAVAIQCYAYIFYKLENADDAYYVAAAATTLVYDSMYCRSPYTGLAVTAFNDRYVCSPYPILQAFFARCTGIPAAAIAHTVLPPFLVLLAYAVFVMIGKMLFADQAGEKIDLHETEKRTGLFILFLSWINITSYYCMKQVGSILLIRVWQGKATLGGVILPFIFWCCYRMAVHKDERGNLFLLLLGSCSAVLASSMGIVLVPFMLGVFALQYGLFQKNRRYFLYMIIGCGPCMITGICNLVIRYIQR